MKVFAILLALFVGERAFEFFGYRMGPIMGIIGGIVSGFFTFLFVAMIWGAFDSKK
jgi:hypothetical protein